MSKIVRRGIISRNCGGEEIAGCSYSRVMLLAGVWR